MTLNENKNNYCTKDGYEQWNQNRDGEIERGGRINKEFDLL